ncbi:HD domain-containing protein [Rhizobacter sp. AJA081-3]|uniref:HD-GYP domain-containing protein n=1 Tax=Rhizobacter sp. AJA081-3 TaxID=2753607 RepID=UPI001ADEDC65|nr:HD domain-containing phosphohydrolase [Rhizobacter sp. AJA081-3]QTN25715.1 HD domain-containing protein [Rhizobacter sp. AJA081-3]
MVPISSGWADEPGAVAWPRLDPELISHGRRVAVLVSQLCVELGVGMASTRAIAEAAATHDVGKHFVPRDILDSPRSLTPMEMACVQQHTRYGAVLLDNAPANPADSSNLASIVALLHHERWDGSGYPYGLLGKEIPVCARIVALADVFDALRTRRPYKPAWSHDVTLTYILDQRGRHFDPGCVDAFLAIESNVAGCWTPADEAFADTR